MHTKPRLSGKRVLVTAAGQGIGLASCLAMAKEGAQVFATDINPQTLSQLAERDVPNIKTFELDALSKASVFEGIKKGRPRCALQLRRLCSSWNNIGLHR